MKIFIQDSGTMVQPDPMQPAKWTKDSRTREYSSVEAIENVFDREHVYWMIENDQLSSRIRDRSYEIFEDQNETMASSEN